LSAREDNPRRVVYEERIRRGRIVDRDGEPLADIGIAPSGLVTRTYPVPQAAPVVGYATLRYGTGGIEAAHDEALRGEEGRGVLEAAWEGLLHRPPEGRDVQLTLDAGLQRLAQEVLEGKAGAAVLLEADSGRVLAMASSPTFHPAHLAETWDALREDPSAPLLNRSTQGLYQPGTALQTVVVAEALREGIVEDLGSGVGGALTERVPVDGSELTCSAPPEGSATLANAYAAGCPAPVGDLGQRLGADGLAQAVARWGLAAPPELALPTEASGWSAEAISAPGVEAVGQGALTVSPLQMALVAATVGNGGAMPEPQLVAAVQDETYRWRRVELGEPRTVLSPSEARTLLSAWRDWDTDGAGSEGEPVPGHWGTAVAGEGNPHAWFIGVSPRSEGGRYAVAVLVEHAADSRSPLRIGCRLLHAAQAGGE
jgi:peptidoglycan glycosyltransferase